jgi:hypothetical protein
MNRFSVPNTIVVIMSVVHSEYIFLGLSLPPGSFASKSGSLTMRRVLGDKDNAMGSKCPGIIVKYQANTFGPSEIVPETDFDCF